MKLLDWIIILGVAAIIANTMLNGFTNIGLLQEANRHNLEMEELDRDFNDKVIELRKAKQFWIESLNEEDAKG